MISVLLESFSEASLSIGSLGTVVLQLGITILHGTQHATDPIQEAVYVVDKTPPTRTLVLNPTRTSAPTSTLTAPLPTPHSPLLCKIILHDAEPANPTVLLLAGFAVLAMISTAIALLLLRSNTPSKPAGVPMIPQKNHNATLSAAILPSRCSNTLSAHRTRVGRESNLARPSGFPPVESERGPAVSVSTNRGSPPPPPPFDLGSSPRSPSSLPGQTHRAADSGPPGPSHVSSNSGPPPPPPPDTETGSIPIPYRSRWFMWWIMLVLLLGTLLSTLVFAIVTWYIVTDPGSILLVVLCLSLLFLYLTEKIQGYIPRRRMKRLCQAILGFPMRLYNQFTESPLTAYIKVFLCVLGWPILMDIMKGAPTNFDPITCHPNQASFRSLLVQYAWDGFCSQLIPAHVYVMFGPAIALLVFRCLQHPPEEPFARLARQLTRFNEEYSVHIAMLESTMAVE